MGSLEGHAYGLAIATDLALPGLHPGTPPGRPRVAVLAADRASVLRAFSGRAVRSWRTLPRDGMTYCLQRGAAGDHLIAHGDELLFHVDAAAERVLCATGAADGGAWARTLMDSVLGTVALLRGYELLHASAVATRWGAVAIAGDSGAGKSSVARLLGRRGARFLADDLVAMSVAGGRVLAHPAPALANVPRELVGAHPGEVVTADGGHAWMHVRRCVHHPDPLAAIVLLSAGDPFGGPRLTEPRGSALDLYPHLLGVRWLPEQAGTRLELLADLLGQARLIRLERGDAPPAVLAALLERALHPTAERAA